jgi:hypothetical protein
MKTSLNKTLSPDALPAAVRIPIGFFAKQHLKQRILQNEINAQKERILNFEKFKRGVLLGQDDDRATDTEMNEQVCGDIFAEDGSVLVRIGTDFRADVEARLDGMYQETAQTTDRVFKGGFVQVNSKMLGR